MDAPGSLPSATPPTLAARLLTAASQIDPMSKIAIIAVFLGWFLVDTLVVTVGPLHHGVRFFDMSAVIADPSRMFRGLQGSPYRMVFIPLCLVCIVAPLLPHVRRNRLLWLTYLAPLALMVICGVLLYSQTSGELIAPPVEVSGVRGNLRRFANDLAHRGSDLAARRISIGAGGYLALAASLVLAAQGVRRFRSTL